MLASVVSPISSFLQPSNIFTSIEFTRDNESPKFRTFSAKEVDAAKSLLVMDMLASTFTSSSATLLSSSEKIQSAPVSASESMPVRQQSIPTSRRKRKLDYYESDEEAELKPNPKRARRFDDDPKVTVTPYSNKKRAPNGEPCANCKGAESTLWRQCEWKNGTTAYLCNACGLRFKKGQYCPECYEVYYIETPTVENWQQCTRCFNWTHKGCMKHNHSCDYVCKKCLS